MHRILMSTITIDCDDYEAGIAFWSAALARKVTYRDEVYATLEPLPGGFEVGLQKVPEKKTCKSRLHLDLATDNIEAEVARLEKLGARKQAWIERWQVMEDPCGNEFCVVGDSADNFDSRAWAVE